ncbi:hypothetical protein AGMMS49983_07130 [Clostridia bacterium]|nr:hypothetical protein AGMMS49983_07130 [Clostridia bacterium]
MINIKYADVIGIGDPPKQIVVIAMPYYPNGSVATKVNSANFLDLDYAIRCLIDVLRGLEYLHENNYYHCDVKPQNILVGNSGEYILSDYGFTSYAPTHEAVTPRQTYLPHAAPEMITENRYDARTDLYQLGVTGYRLINGISLVKDEFELDRVGFNQKVLDGRIVTASAFQAFVPRRLRKVILKAVAANPDERYQTALEMRRELERIDIKGATATADEHGCVTIRKAGYSYYFRIEYKARGDSVFQAYKKNEKTNRITKVGAYTRSVTTPNDIRKAEENFFLNLMK